MDYPKDWPRCPHCGAPALDGRITCGSFQCDEHGTRRARARALSAVSAREQRERKDALLREWSDFDRTPLCGFRYPDGRLCANPVCAACDFAPFYLMHRKATCEMHGNRGKVA
jgi:hypothetical protein